MADKTDEELVSLYADLVASTRRELNDVNERLADYASRLSQAADRVAAKRL